MSSSRPGSAAQLELADGGSTQYVIVQAAEAGEAEVYAVEELARHLKQVTGAEFTVVSETIKQAGPRILVGPGALSRSILGKQTVDSLGAEDYVIRTVGSDLLLVGGRTRGTLYAVYHFLDNIVGIRWWAPGATFVPKKPDLHVDALDIRGEPAFEYREAFLTTAWEPDWAARNRLTGVVRRDPTIAEPVSPDAKHGGGVSYGARFVHSFGVFISPDEHFDDHPEWFSEINGKRAKRALLQLCLSNPEVLDLMVKQVKAYIADNPEADIVSVSQNDNTAGCECVDCRKIDDEEGSPAGSMLRFVNAVAERIEGEHPEVYISTLAYQYTRRPPKHVRPRHNVIVRLCNIECSFAQPLESQATSFVKDLRDWSAITDNLYVWDYIANFSDYFRPHPNLRVLGPNVRFFKKNRVKGVFEQGSFMTKSGEMEELRAWVLARLLWNPQQDDRALIDEFVNGYYGDAAGYIGTYLNLTHDAVEDSDYFMGIAAGDPSPYVTPKIMARAELLFQQAEAAVADQPDVLTRVRRAHMPVQCMWLKHYDDDAWKAEAGQQGSVVPQRETLLASLIRQVEADEITTRSEGGALASFLTSLRNTALVSTVRASGATNGSYPFEVFEDGDSFWNSGGYGPQWIQKDLGKMVRIKAIDSVFEWRAAGAIYDSMTYKIDGSRDGETWYVLVPETTTRTGKGRDVLPAPVDARFVRTTLLKAHSVMHPEGEWVGMSSQRMELETEILEITTGAPTFLSPERYQNTANVVVSRTGVAAAFYPKGTMFYRISTDGGRTWGEERACPVGVAGRMSVGLRDGGVLFMAGQAAPVDESDPPKLQARRIVFSDDFLTYEDSTSDVSIPQAGLNTRWATFWPVFDKGKIVQLPNGDLLANLYGNFKGDAQYRTMLVRSTDAGRSWQFYATVAYDPDDPHPFLVGSYCGYCEPSLALLTNGQLLCTMRTQGAQYAGEYRPLYQSWSDDLGKTWTKPVPTEPHLMNISPTLAVLDNGVVACQTGRPGFHVSFSLDNGHTWQDRIRFSDLPEPIITGQFDMFKVGANGLLAIGSDDGGTRIWPIEVRRVKVSQAHALLEGRVLDPQGNPVADAAVERSPNRYYFDSWLEHPTELDPWKATPMTVGSPVLGYRSIRERGYPVVRTDARGRFRFESVPLGEYVLTVEADGHAPRHRHIKVEPESKPQDFQLKAGLKICNRVMDNTDQPVPGACVVLNRWHVHTDRDGFFHWSVEAPLPEQVEVNVYRRYGGHKPLKTTLPLSQLAARPLILP